MDRAVPYVLVGLLALGLMVVLGFVAAHGIGKLGEAGEPAAYSEEEWLGPSGPDPAFVYAEPVRYPSPPPPSLVALLPRTRSEVLAFPQGADPSARVRARLAVGDAEVRAALLASIRSATRDGASDEEVARALTPMLSAESSATHCAWMRGVIQGPAPEASPVAELFWDALPWCGDVETAMLLEEPAAPPRALVTWLEIHPWAARATPAERIEAAEAALRRAGHAERADAARILLERVRSEVSAPGPETFLRDMRTAVPLFAERWPGPPDALARSLVRCATAAPSAPGGPGEWRSAECLGALHARNPAMALHAARAVVRSSPDTPYLAEMAKVVAEGMAPEELVRRLRDHGLLAPGDEPEPGGGEAIAPRDVLIEHGRAFCFPSEPATYPVGHDGLATRLAHLARPALDDVAFVESPPQQGAQQYILDAHADGENRSAYPAVLGGQYDVHTVLGLLNALLRERSSPLRFAWLAVPGWQLQCVVAAPEAGLLAAERERLITLQDPAS